MIYYSGYICKLQRVKNNTNKVTRQTNYQLRSNQTIFACRLKFQFLTKANIGQR